MADQMVAGEGVLQVPGAQMKLGTKYNTTGDQTTGAAGSTTTVFLNTTFTGNSGTTAYKIGDIVAALKSFGLLAK